MRHSSKYNFWAWVALVALTASGFAASGQLGRAALVLFLSVSACVKIFLVAYQFMELKKGHPAWLALVVFVLVVFVGMVVRFYF